jgi:hypothetical protein
MGLATAAASVIVAIAASADRRRFDLESLTCKSDARFGKSGNTGNTSNTSNSARKVQVVVSRYAEDVSWLDRLPYRDLIVYDKFDQCDKGTGKMLEECHHGNPPTYATVVKLPNVGRCDHTYLHHIVENWDDLADVTLFVPGSCPAFKDKWRKLQWVVDRVCDQEGSAFPVTGPYLRPIHHHLAHFQIDKYEATDLKNSSFNPENSLQPSAHRPFGTFFNEYFPEHPGVHHVIFQGIFAVTREDIRHTSRETYARLADALASHSNPEAGHFMERCWLACFTPFSKERLSSANRDWGEEAFSILWAVIALVSLAWMTGGPIAACGVLLIVDAGAQVVQAATGM